MRIANSNVAMASQRTYTESGRQAVSTIGRNAAAMVTKGLLTQAEANSNWADMLSLSTDKDGGSGLSETYDKHHGVRKLGRTANAQDLSMNGNELRDSLLGGILARFQSIGFDMSGIAERVTDSLGGWSMVSVSELSYYEEEYTSFSAGGMALTEDGRQIDFSIEMEMSRSFSLYSRTEIPLLSNAFKDPLVVNVGSGVPHISDQKFKFDIDMDGILDEISMPTQGSGFLALDGNGDGKINDGSELFGTQSGDGFKDLAKYDSDGNGWIDENDDIFDKLKIWYKNSDGEDELVNLKEADIGAIYLGEQSTTFKLQGADFATDGMVRSTGIFLHESTGLAGTIQHIDLAVGAKEDVLFGSSENGRAGVYAVDDEGAERTDGSVYLAENGESAEGSGRLTEKEERSEKSERESEAQRRREKRLKRKQEEQVRIDKRRAERERMEKLHAKQQERKEEIERRFLRHREARLRSEKEAKKERLEHEAEVIAVEDAVREEATA